MRNKLLYMTGCLVFCLCSCQPNTIKNREAGALSGGVLGAGLGAIIGHQTGHTGAGIAIGSAIGALSGGVVGNEVDNQQAQIDATNTQIEEQDRIIEENKRLLQELRRLGADARSSDRGVVVNLPDVLYKFDSAELTPDAKRTVADIAGVLREVQHREVLVEGHTDSIGTLSYNQKLSEARAKSAADGLVVNGISRRRIRTSGFGETDPIASNKTELGRRRNRRVEIVIVNDSSL